MLKIEILATYLDIEPREVAQRLRHAADRTRPFYKGLLESYYTYEKLYPTFEAELNRQRDRLYRLGIPPELKDNPES
jgi:hypothetical protein